MNYEFHVGDYVETIGGFVGWISDVKNNNYIVVVDKNNNVCSYHMPQESYYFIRIGQYDFTQQDKKIEKMQTTFTSSNYNDDGWHIKSILELRQKVNELIDAVNEKCNNCRLRYPCDEQTKFICKHNNYCKYISE